MEVVGTCDSWGRAERPCAHGALSVPGLKYGKLHTVPPLPPAFLSLPELSHLQSCEQNNIFCYKQLCLAFIIVTDN